jgi:thiamine transporter ThiT
VCRNKLPDAIALTRWGRTAVETIYDWVTVGLFAGLVVLFLQRSSEDQPRDGLLEYLVAGLGLAIANYFGNHDQDIIAILLIAGTVAFVLFYLKPFQAGPEK